MACSAGQSIPQKHQWLGNMKISTILDQIESGFIALPEFQRGYVWNRQQVRGLFRSLYRRYPVGGLLVWATATSGTTHRGDGALPAGLVKLLLDGQQRMTSLYGVIRGTPPKFFDGDKRSFTGLRFHLEDEVFEFYQPVKMRDDLLWIDISQLMIGGYDFLEKLIEELASNPALGTKAFRYTGRISKLISIQNIDLHIDEVTGNDKTIDIVVDIFNRVNSGGTKLSKGDLALAKICAEWPEARNVMKAKLKEWSDAGYSFKLDWFLRSVNTVLTGEAKFNYLHDLAAKNIEDGVNRASKHIDTCLNLIADRLGLDHNRVLFGRFGVPVMIRYIDSKQGHLNADEINKLAFWFAHAGMWGRFSGSTETGIDKNLEALEGEIGGLDRLIKQLHIWHGDLLIRPLHFEGWSIGARFYPVLYMLTRMGAARDLCVGFKLHHKIIGRMHRLEVHHIFPKSRLYHKGYRRADVNALANYCFLTKDCNLKIRNKLPEDYLPKAEAEHPGVLASQWIPSDPNLWNLDRYHDFLDARRKLLADAANKYFKTLLGDHAHWIESDTIPQPTVTPPVVVGGISGESEELEIKELNAWVTENSLTSGEVSFDYADPETGVQNAVFDLAWPNGLQPGLTAPVAVLLNEPQTVLDTANSAGFRYFTTVAAFRRYVETEILGASTV